MGFSVNKIMNNEYIRLAEMRRQNKITNLELNILLSQLAIEHGWIQLYYGYSHRMPIYLQKLHLLLAASVF